MAIFQLIFDVTEDLEETTEDVILLRLPLDLMQIFDKECEPMQFYAPERHAFTALWAMMLEELMLQIPQESNALLKNAMQWIKDDHWMEEFRALHLIGDVWERYIITFSDKDWEDDLRVQIGYVDHEDAYGEVNNEHGITGIYLFDHHDLKGSKQTHRVVGSAMKAALEEPFPVAYFDELCDEIWYKATLPYLVLFQLNAFPIHVSERKQYWNLN